MLLVFISWSLQWRLQTERTRTSGPLSSLSRSWIKTKTESLTKWVQYIKCQSHFSRILCPSSPLSPLRLRPPILLLLFLLDFCLFPLYSSLNFRNRITPWSLWKAMVFNFRFTGRFKSSWKSRISVKSCWKLLEVLFRWDWTN